VEIVKELSKAIMSVPHNRLSQVDEGAAAASAATARDAERVASSGSAANAGSGGRVDQKVHDVLYLGCQTVAKSMGAEIIEAAVLQNEDDIRRRESVAGSKASEEGDPVTVVLTPLSIRTVERRSGDTILNDFIRHVTFSCIMEGVNGKEIFAYIACEERVSSKTCHIFAVASGSARSVRNDLKGMVKLSDAQETTGNPFSAVAGCPREVPKGPLFQKQIHRGDLTPVKVIGAGQYGEVYLAVQTARLPGTKGGGVVKLKRAVKMVRNNATMEDKKEFLREAETMIKLEHENLVKLIGVAVQQAPWLAVLEFCEHGDLRSVVRACHQHRIRLTTEEQVSFCQQLAGGMAHLTAQGMVHMDLAARNCLLARANVVKVADFGLTRSLDPGTNLLVLRERLKLPLKWLSIEALDKKVFGEWSDCWSFGILMWEILSYGETPYTNVRTADVQEKVRGGLRLQKPPGADQNFWTIVSRCWIAQPNARWTFANLQKALRGLLLRIPEGPKRDIGVFLKSKGKDLGDSNPRLKTPREMLESVTTVVTAATKFKQPLRQARATAIAAAPERPSTAPTLQQSPPRGPASAGGAASAGRTPTSRPSVKAPQSANGTTSRSPRSPVKTPQSAAQMSRPSNSTAASPPAPKTRQLPRPSAEPPQRSMHVSVKSPADPLNPMFILSRLGLPQYAPLLREKKITQQQFVNANDTSLQQIGVANTQHRKFIIDYIHQQKHGLPNKSQPTKPRPSPRQNSAQTELNKKRAELERVRSEAARKKKMADDLLADNTSARQAAREAAQINSATDSPRTAARRREEQSKAAERAKRLQADKESTEEARREAAISSHAEEARRLAAEQLEASRKQEERLRRERVDAETNERRAAAEKRKSISDGSRVDALVTRKGAEKERAEKAATLTVSRQAERRMSPRKGSSEDIFGKKDEEWGAGKSKIWKALNPQPLAFQTAKDRSEREEKKATVSGSRVGGGADFLLRDAAAKNDVDFVDSDDDGDEGHSPARAARPKPKGDGMNRTGVMQEDEDSDDEALVSAAEVGLSGDLDGDIESMLKHMRAKREQEEKERQEKLRLEFEARKKVEQEALEKEMAVIRARKELERKEEEERKDRLVAEAHAQQEELVFDFSW